MEQDPPEQPAHSIDQETPEQPAVSAQENPFSNRGRLVTGLACVACSLVFIGLMQEPDPDSWNTLSRYGYLPAVAIWDGRYWALLSSVFVHRELVHFAFNVYWLWILGRALEREIGPLRFLAFFIGSAVVSSGIQLAVGGSTGIGASGVVYAIFGFLWMASDCIEAFKNTVTKRLIVTFLGWGVICILGTLLGTMNIGNAAHIGGLLFGAGVAMVFVRKRVRVMTAAGLVGLILIALVPLFWSPWSPDWTSKQAYDAHLRHDYVGAVIWYQRTIDLGGNTGWALENMARAYGSMGDQPRYEETLDRLRLRDSEAAERVEQVRRAANTK